MAEEMVEYSPPVSESCASTSRPTTSVSPSSGSDVSSVRVTHCQAYRPDCRRAHRPRSASAVSSTLGNPIDGKGPIEARRASSCLAQGSRYSAPSVGQGAMQTGIKPIDAMVPIGRGQVSSSLVTVRPVRPPSPSTPILNQKRWNDGQDESRSSTVYYVAVGQKRSTVAQLVKVLEENDAMKYTSLSPPPPRGRSPPVHSLPSRVPPSASGSVTTASTPSSSTMTCPSRPSPTVRCRSSSVVLRCREAYPGDVSSTSTLVSSSVLPR